MNLQIEETIGFDEAAAAYEAELDYETCLGYTTEAEYWEEYDLIKSGKYDINNLPF